METYNLTDCIFSPITAIENSSVIVVRISGTASQISKCCTTLGLKNTSLKHQYASLKSIYFYNNQTKKREVLDKAIITYYKSPKSFTGEDVIEISIHGSRFIYNKLCSVLLNIPDTRFAEAGEFLYRSFLNEKITLAEAEAVNALIESETESQHQLANQHVKGYGMEICKKWKQILTHIMASLEGYIDFSEEHNINDNLLKEMETSLNQIISQIKQYTNNNISQQIISGINIAIFGKPNSGKSSLFNRLSGNDAAIVSDISGTTRDILQTKLNISNIAVNLYDTAGITKSTDIIEQQGVSKAVNAVKESDINILLVDASNQPSILFDSIKDILNYINGSPSDAKKAQSKDIKSKPLILVFSKIDLVPNFSDWLSSLPPILLKLNFVSILATSVTSDILYGIKVNNSSTAQNSQNLDEIFSIIGAVLINKFNQNADNIAYITSRQRVHLVKTISYLENIAEEINLNSTNIAPEILSHKMQQALKQIQYITGEIMPDNVLDEVFSNFCIGK